MSESLEGMTPEAIAGLALLAKGLTSNPGTRERFLKMAKEAHPNMSIPEVDIPFRIDNAIADERGKREALENKIRENEVREEVRRKRDALKASKKLTDEDVVEVEKLMLEKGINNHETATEYMLAQRQSAKPTPFNGFGSQQVPKPDTKDFGGNIAQWARNEAAQTINDIRTGRIAV